MKILVTGAKGFIGKNLIAELKNQKYTDIYETLYSKVDFLNYVQKSTVKFSDTLLKALKELNIKLEK